VARRQVKGGERAQAHEWVGQAEVKKIFYFRQPNYVWWSNRKKTVESNLIFDGLIFLTVLRPNF
jgi:hypothetical protein